MLQAAQLIIYHSKLEIYKNFQTKTNKRNEQTEYVYCHPLEFLHNILC